MDESPSKYDQQNQRMSYATDGINQQNKSARWASGMPDDIAEESDQHEEQNEKKKKRRKGKNGGYIVEEITGRDIQMASAYGGVAKPRIRKVGPQFARINRVGLQTSYATRVANPKMGNLTTAR